MRQNEGKIKIFLFSLSKHTAQRAECVQNVFSPLSPTRYRHRRRVVPLCAALLRNIFFTPWKLWGNFALTFVCSSESCSLIHSFVHANAFFPLFIVLSPRQKLTKSVPSSSLISLSHLFQHFSSSLLPTAAWVSVNCELWECVFCMWLDDSLELRC